MSSALYNRDILRLAASVPNLGRLAEPQGSAEKRSPVCGSRVVVDVALDREGRIAALGQEVKACALGQASAALMARQAIGRSFGELVKARNELAAFLVGARDDPGSWPGIEALIHAKDYAARHASIMLPFEAAAEAAAAAAAVRPALVR